MTPSFSARLALLGALLTGCSGTSDLGGHPVAPPDGGGAGPDGGAPSGDGAAPGPGPVSGPLDPSLAARAAVFIGSCIPDDLSNRYLDRMYTGRSAEPSEVLYRSASACFATKTNGCTAVAECLGIRTALVPGCASKCDGNVAVSCDGSLEFRVDCATSGASCAPVGSDTGCFETTPVACDSSTFVTTCTDGRPTFCSGHVVRNGPTCADYGLGCAEMAGQPTIDVCKSTGPACTSGSYGPGDAKFEGMTCTGAATLLACVNDSQTSIDCAAIGTGFTCQSSGGRSFCGLGGECGPGILTKPTCDGSSLVLCNAGKIMKIDCTALGFTGCSAQFGTCIPTGWAP